MNSQATIGREWAVVTGASAGIGRAFAVALAERGHPVLLVARRREELDKVGAEIGRRGARFRILVADLSTTHGLDLAVREAVALGEVGVLVNNAGFGGYGPFLEQPVGRELAQVALNVGAMVALTRALLPQMVARRRGQIINVASVLSFMPTPYFATYSATKAFVLHFTEALAHELRGSGVRALATCPGTAKTDFASVAGSEAAQARLPVLSPEAVVRVSLRAADAGRVVRVVGMAYRLLAFVTRVTPRFVMRKIMGTVFAPAAAPSAGPLLSAASDEEPRPSASGGSAEQATSSIPCPGVAIGPNLTRTRTRRR